MLGKGDSHSGLDAVAFMLDFLPYCRLGGGGAVAKLLLFVGQPPPQDLAAPGKKSWTVLSVSKLILSYVRRV